VDEKTQLKFSDFFNTKIGMVEPTCQLFYKWKKHGIPVKIVRYDDAGENKTLKARCDSSDWKLNIEFEFIGRDTPQRNHLAKLGLASIANKGRALMYRANVPEEVRYLLWKEAFKTATLLDGLMPIEINGKIATKFEHWCGSNLRFINHLRTWGEAGTVKVVTSTTPKIHDR
jgi:hypothetical protein